MYDGSESALAPSAPTLVSYSGKVIKPKGKITLAHQSPQAFTLLDFEVVDLPMKLALLGLSDSVRLSLIDVDPSRVSVQGSNSSDCADACEQAALSVPLSKQTVLSQFSSVFSGLGNVGKPVVFTLKPDIRPVHALQHRVPNAEPL